MAANLSGVGAATAHPLLELRQIGKSFPGVRANDSIDLAIMPGEIHALLGENGAGKSTLVKIIYGLIAPDQGQIIWQGEPVRIAGPADARRRGIGMVFQHFSLFDSLTVLENIALVLPNERNMAALRERIIAVSVGYGLPLDPDQPVYAMSVGERQRIEIVRCLLQSPRLIILDEPTSVLTPQEAARLFDTLRQLAHEGRAILYISHKLAEVQALCQRATVLRQGRVVATCKPAGQTARSLAEMMIGESLGIPDRRGRAAAGAVCLQVIGLSLPAVDRFGVALADVTFEVRSGEILGIAGVAGNGQSELMAALTGERMVRRRPHAIRIDGVPVGAVGPRGRRRLGAAFVPEERIGQGAVPTMPLWENALLTAFTRMPLLHHGFIAAGASRRFTGAVVKDYDVRTTGTDTEAGSLSGGNLQKFIVGREMLQMPRLLVVAQPTWGVDAGAAVRIHQAIMNLAAAGTAVLVISQDLDEIFAICDRIAVIAGGRLSPAQPIEDATVAGIGLLMAGIAGDAAHA